MNNRQPVRRTNQDCGLPAALREADRAVARGEEVGLPALLKSLFSKLSGKTVRKAPLQPLPEYHWGKNRVARVARVANGNTSQDLHDPSGTVNDPDYYYGDSGFYGPNGSLPL